MARLSSKPTISHKDWLTYCSEISSILTCIIVILIFIIVTIFSVKIYDSMNNVTIIIDKIKKFVKIESFDKIANIIK